MKIRKELWFGFTLMGLIVLAALYMLVSVERIERGHIGLLMLSLVVVAIIALLIAILLPSLGKARVLARRTQCAAVLHGWGQAIAIYAAENQNQISAKNSLGTWASSPGIYGSALANLNQKVRTCPAPSVYAASSWSVPISRSTGTTSRMTNGRHTKMVARIIPGTAKMMVMPWSASHPPMAPLVP